MCHPTSCMLMSNVHVQLLKWNCFHHPKCRDLCLIRLWVINYKWMMKLNSFLLLLKGPASQYLCRLGSMNTSYTPIKFSQSLRNLDSGCTFFLSLQWYIFIICIAVYLVMSWISTVCKFLTVDATETSVFTDILLLLTLISAKCIWSHFTYWLEFELIVRLAISTFQKKSTWHMVIIHLLIGIHLSGIGCLSNQVMIKRLSWHIFHQHK